MHSKLHVAWLSCTQRPSAVSDVRHAWQAVAEYGEKWSQVAQHVPSRTDVQCRERFKNVLDPKLTAEPWTAGVIGQDDASRACASRHLLVVSHQVGLHAQSAFSYRRLSISLVCCC